MFRLRADQVPRGRRLETGAVISLRQPSFELVMPPAPEPVLDTAAIVGEVHRAGTRRVLLDTMALPMPPSMNDYWHQRIVKAKATGKLINVRYTSQAAKAYQELIKSLMLDRKAWYRSENPLSLKMLLCFADERPSDIDNRVKPLQDALAFAQVMVNDKQVKRLQVRQGPNMKPMVCYVTLTEILPDRQANLNWIRAQPQK